MNDYYNSLNSREKWMVWLAGVSLVIYGFYFFLYSPLSNKVSLRSTQLVEKIHTLQWMKKVKQENHSVQEKQNLSNSQLLTLIATQLKDNERLNFPFQLQQTGTGEIQLSYDAVPVQLFLTWLSSINEQYAFTIKQLDIEKTKTSGVGKVLIIISGAG